MTLIKQKVSSLKRNPAFTHLMESGRQDAYSSFYAARMNDAQAGKGRKQNVGMKDMDNLTLMGKNNIINEEKTDSLSLNTKQLIKHFRLQVRLAEKYDDILLKQVFRAGGTSL